MTNLGKRCQWLGAHALGGRITGDQLRIIGFQRLQFTQAAVVLRIRQFRRVQHVVLVIGAIEDFVQFHCTVLSV